MVTRTHVLECETDHTIACAAQSLNVRPGTGCYFHPSPGRPGVSFIAPQVIAGRDENRAMQAWAGRYQGLANDYAKPAAANAAWAARYQGLADAYTIKTTSANAAYAARYQGLANLEATHSMRIRRLGRPLPGPGECRSRTHPAYQRRLDCPIPGYGRRNNRASRESTLPGLPDTRVWPTQQPSAPCELTLPGPPVIRAWQICIHWRNNSTNAKTKRRLFRYQKSRLPQNLLLFPGKAITRPLML